MSEGFSVDDVENLKPLGNKPPHPIYGQLIGSGVDTKLSIWQDKTKFGSPVQVPTMQEIIEKAKVDGVFIDPVETARLHAERNTVMVEPVEMEEYTEIIPTNDGTIVRKAWRKKHND